MHPKGYTKEMIKEILGTAWLDKDNIAESGNQIRRRKGNVDKEEMKRVFNLGIGYCVVVPANRLELTMDIIRDEGINCWEIGEVYDGHFK